MSVLKGRAGFFGKRIKEQRLQKCGGSQVLALAILS